jgi:invasion protein IalB
MIELRQMVATKTSRFLPPALATFCLATAFFLAPAPSGAQQAQAQQGAAANAPRALGQFGDWGVFASGKANQRSCYALARPAASQTNPPNRPRDPIYLFVTNRPGDNVRNEVSVVFGYSHRENTDATLEIGSARFPIQTDRDGGWIKNAADAGRLLEAMRGGQEAVLRGVSGRGTQTTDRFSLRGLSQALERAEQECR